MENNENKNTKKSSKKFLVAFIVILAIILVVAIPVSLLSTSKPAKSKDNGLKPAKKVKEYECIKKDKVCTFDEMYEGVEVNVEVAEGKTYTFSMIANDKETMTLMLQQNVVDSVEWHKEEINMKGPQYAIQMLNEKIADWDNISNIEKYTYEDGGKKDYERICNSDVKEPEYKCITENHKTSGYNGLKIENGETTFLFNLQSAEDEEAATEGSIMAKAKARLITLEEVEEFSIDKGLPKWLIEDLDKNEAYWTMTSSPSMTTAYYQGAIAIANIDNKLSVEAKLVVGEKDSKVGLRPVITIAKK